MPAGHLLIATIISLIIVGCAEPIPASETLTMSQTASVAVASTATTPLTDIPTETPHPTLTPTQPTSTPTVAVLTAPRLVAHLDEESDWLLFTAIASGEASVGLWAINHDGTEIARIIGEKVLSFEVQSGPGKNCWPV